MSDDQYEHEVTTEIVKVNGQYVVKLYATIDMMKMHAADIGPFPTRESAEEMAEHMTAVEEAEREEQ